MKENPDVKLDDVAAAINVKKITPTVPTGDVVVTMGYASDLLSDVLAGAPRGAVLVTVQAHLNVIAVAVHAELAAVIFAANRAPERAVVERAAQERIPLYVSEQAAFDIVGRLYELGLRGPTA